MNLFNIILRLHIAEQIFSFPKNISATQFNSLLRSKMGVAQAMEALTERAGLMKESLQKSQTITDNMVGILGSFDHRLSALETAMRPTQVS